MVSSVQGSTDLKTGQAEARSPGAAGLQAAPGGAGGLALRGWSLDGELFSGWSSVPLTSTWRHSLIAVGPSVA